MRVLVMTKIFPNAAEPLSAPFNRQQIAALGRRCDVEVLAPLPWFPGASLFGRWSGAGKLTSVPRDESIDGLEVTHPRTPYLPRFGHVLSAALYGAAVYPEMRRSRGAFDVLLGTWAYPDGVAAVALGRAMGVPTVVKLHGSDMDVLSKRPSLRRQLAWALPRAARVVAVSRALADEVVALGVPRERVAIVMNGVDGELFHPRDRAAARAELGLPAGEPLALYVGNLKEEKGVLDLARAWADVPAGRLAIVGGGPARAALEAALPARATLHGPQPLAAIPTWLAACDVLVLPSHAEGTPNVVLEALACGRRVVATRVGGIPDLLSTPVLGALVPPHDPPALAAAVAQALRDPYDAAQIAALGARGGWDASAAALFDVIAEAASS